MIMSGMKYSGAIQLCDNPFFNSLYLKFSEDTRLVLKPSTLLQELGSLLYKQLEVYVRANYGQALKNMNIPSKTGPLIPFKEVHVAEEEFGPVRTLRRSWSGFISVFTYELWCRHEDRFGIVRP